MLVLDFEDKGIRVVGTVTLDAAHDQRQGIVCLFVGRNKIGRSGIPKRIHHSAHPLGRSGRAPYAVRDPA